MSSPTTRDLLKSMMDDLEELDRGITELTEERNGLALAIDEVQKRIGGADHPERFKGMTKVEAAKRCLSDHGGPLGTASIVDTLLAGGLETVSSRENFYNALYQALGKQAKKWQQSGIKKVGGKWVLVPAKIGGDQ